MLKQRLFKRLVPRHSKSGNLFLLVTNDLDIGFQVLRQYLDKYGELDKVVWLPTYTTDEHLVNKFPDCELMYLPKRYFMKYVEGGKMAEFHKRRGKYYGTPFSAIFKTVINDGKNGIKAIHFEGAAKLHTLFPNLEVGIGFGIGTIHRPVIEAIIPYSMKSDVDGLVYRLREIVMKYNAIRRNK